MTEQVEREELAALSDVQREILLAWVWGRLPAEERTKALAVVTPADTGPDQPPRYHGL